jgi:hypothetical protein
MTIISLHYAVNGKAVPAFNKARHEGTRRMWWGNASNILNVGTRQGDGDLLHILPVYPQGKETVL